MARKKKYKNAEIVKGILSRESCNFGDLQNSLLFRFLDFKKKNDREFLITQIDDIMKIFLDAKKELKGE